MAKTRRKCGSSISQGGKCAIYSVIMRSLRTATTGISKEYEDLFRRMRDELVNCSWGYEEMLTFLFRQLLMTMRRRMTENAPRVSGFIQDEMDRARTYFEEHYNEDFSIEQYAVSRNMSTSWFNRSFRSAMGTSPMKYILDIRIRNAQTLLETTDFALQIPQDLPRTVHGGGRCEGRGAVIMTA